MIKKSFGVEQCRETSVSLKIPPPLYLILFAVMMWFLKNNMPLYIWESSISIMFGMILIVIGIGLDLLSLRGFVKAKTTINPLKPHNTSTLVTRGMYRITRNPMYLGLLCILTGWAFYLSSLVGVLLLPLFVWTLTIMQIIPEEKILEEKYSAQYLAYKSNVRRWI